MCCMGIIDLPKPKHHRLQNVVQSGVGGWVSIVVELLSPDVHLNILTGHLNLLLTKSRVYNTISDYHDNRSSHVN